ncbi:helical backbone metal receptor [Reichenbachiella agarivorans]|uniref:Helical backbone metal receptor n=1 Tax=Reichenbachiella agarivorans TaxID=2979464 RepID=A0ABY6CU44_9BACT|nr:helical backbone metal receptor [Reichenbachiella agarivorans]UXP34041.1 helical backbone metal receptor [Reichenbachiella agarivorans]
MKTTTDQLKRTVSVPDFPQRIISLVPSITELLFDLGLGDRVVGITKFCVHPARGLQEKTKIGGTKNIKTERIASLNPDLILANKEENTKSDIEGIWDQYPVWVSDVNGLSDALDMIESVGWMTQTETLAGKWISDIEASFAQLTKRTHVRTLYMIWQSPWMSVGTDTFVYDMLSRCGFDSVIRETRYPQLTDEEIIGLNPEVVLLSSEPFPFKETHVQRMQEILPEAKVILVDGEMFSWYGSRLGLSAAYFQSIMREILW